LVAIAVLRCFDAVAWTSGRLPACKNTVQKEVTQPSVSAKSYMSSKLDYLQMLKSR